MSTHHTRRGVLKRVTGLVTAATGGTTTAAARDETPPSTGGATARDWLQYDRSHEPRPPATDLIHHLSSGIRYMDLDTDAIHAFTFAGQFGIETPTEYPPQEGTANTESQAIRIVNETPMKLSLFFPETPVAMYPSATNQLSIPWLETLSAISGVAIPLLKKVGLTLLKRGFFWLGIVTGIGLVLKHFFRREENKHIHHFKHFTPLWNDIQGRHLARLRVREHTTDGTGQLLVASQTRHAINAWRLTFDNGLTDVSPLSTTPTSRHGIRSEVEQ